MIEITVKDVVDSIPVLNSFASKELPAKTAFIAARLLNQINEEYKVFETTREKLVNEYGEHDDDGQLKVRDDGTVYILPERMLEFQNSLQELLDTKITIATDLLPLSSLEQLNFTPAEMHSLLMFIDSEK